MTMWGSARQSYWPRLYNLIVLGGPEEGETLEGATSDSDKVSKVWDAASITCNVKSLRRIGQRGERRRPILVEVVSRADRDSALDKTRDLKGHSNDIYKRIFVKKDQHLSVRAEWKRLHECLSLKRIYQTTSPAIFILILGKEKYTNASLRGGKVVMVKNYHANQV